MRGFVNALVQEVRLRLPQGSAVDTLYFGGGTPSMLSPTHLQLLTDGLQHHLDFSHLREWTLEANPATFTTAKARHWRKLGITRISLGAQSFLEQELLFLGREHSPTQIRESISMLRAVGIPQVNIDLIFCLPGQSPQALQRSLELALACAPDHISTYSLTLEPGTPFASLVPPDEDTQVQMYDLAHRLLTDAGFRHYEVSNYAHSSSVRCLHNLACWRGEDYAGLGPGACGTMRGIRYENIHDTARYISSLAQGSLPPDSATPLSPTQRRTELIALGLRTDEGIPLSLLPPDKTPIIPTLLHEGLCTLSADRLIPSPRGLLLADEIALQFI